MTATIGDVSQYDDPGMNEPDLAWYHCPFCGERKEVVVEWDTEDRQFYPVRLTDLKCQCEADMDRGAI